MCNSFSIFFFFFFQAEDGIRDKLVTGVQTCALPISEGQHAALRAAYLAGAAVVTPHPRAHALYADKRNLALLSDASRLAALGVRQETIEVLLQGVPRTRLVSAGIAEGLWADRRKLFFKPAAGHGSKGAYRGDKLTKRVWNEIQQSAYVAQELVPP